MSLLAQHSFQCSSSLLLSLFFSLVPHTTTPLFYISSSSFELFNIFVLFYIHKLLFFLFRYNCLSDIFDNEEWELHFFHPSIHCPISFLLSCHQPALLFTLLFCLFVSYFTLEIVSAEHNITYLISRHTLSTL